MKEEADVKTEKRQKKEAERSSACEERNKERVKRRRVGF